MDKIQRQYTGWSTSHNSIIKSDTGHANIVNTEHLPVVSIGQDPQGFGAETGRFDFIENLME